MQRCLCYTLPALVSIASGMQALSSCKGSASPLRLAWADRTPLIALHIVTHRIQLSMSNTEPASIWHSAAKKARCLTDMLVQRHRYDTAQLAEAAPCCWLCSNTNAVCTWNTALCNHKCQINEHSMTVSRNAGELTKSRYVIKPEHK